ncbi:hypothetical protein THAOC_01797, partial [Thalassiosira oceanica]
KTGLQLNVLANMILASMVFWLAFEMEELLQPSEDLGVRRRGRVVFKLMKILENRRRMSNELVDNSYQVSQFVCSGVSATQYVISLKSVKFVYDFHRLGKVSLQGRTFNFVLARYLSQDKLAVPLYDNVFHAQCPGTLDASDKPTKFCLVVSKSIAEKLHAAPNFCLGDRVVEDHPCAGDAWIAARSAVKAEHVGSARRDPPIGIELFPVVKLGRKQPNWQPIIPQSPCPRPRVIAVSES